MINGKGLKKLRTYKGYHQKEIANSLNVCQQYVSKLENRISFINEVSFRNILDAMEISEKEWEQIKHLFTPPPRKMTSEG